jgi:hypothetical protein
MQAQQPQPKEEPAKCLKRPFTPSAFEEGNGQDLDGRVGEPRGEVVGLVAAVK